MMSLSVIILFVFILTNLFYIVSSGTIGPSVSFRIKKYSHNYSFIKIGEQILIENQPFTIKIASDDGISYLKCNSALVLIHNGVMQENENDKYFFVEKEKAVPEMGGNWKCNAKILSNYEIEVKIKVHVRRKGVGAIQINNKNIETTQTELFVYQYDEIGSYSFTDGETSLFSCKALEPGNNNISMIYHHNNTGIKIVMTGHDQLSIMMKMTDMHDGGYLECQVNVYSTNDFSKIRLYFAKGTSNVGKKRLIINGNLLLPVSTMVNYDEYNYEYFDGETVDIEINMDHLKYRGMECLAKGVTPDKLARFRELVPVPLDVRYSVVFKKENNNLRLLCNAYVNVLKSVDNFAINFVSYDENNVTDFNPIIIGLSRSSILLKYKENKNLGIIYYEYSNNRPLELKCVSKQNRYSHWKFNDAELTSKEVISRHQNIAEVRRFTMREGYKKAVILCRGEHSTSRLVLIKQSYANEILFGEVTDSDNVVPTKSNLSVIPLSGIKLQDQVSSTDETHSDHRIIYYVIGAFVASIIISVSVWMIIIAYKRGKKAERTNSNFNYENLPEHSSGPMPVPHQWQSRDEPPYSTPVDVNIDAMYTKPIPTQLRPRQLFTETVSAIYAEVQYAEPNLVNSESRNHPCEGIKTEANKDNRIKYANVEFDEQIRINKDGSKEAAHTTQYAEPNFDSRNHPYAEIMPNKYANINLDERNRIKKDGSKETAYAEIIDGASRKDDKYENVFDGQRYGNIHSKKKSDEPAYCEMLG